MNKQMTYEITIKKKLENIPVPDLSEMIWARIENELDTDPGDSSDNNPPSPSSPTGGIILGGTALLFIMALTFYFLTKKPNDIPQIDKVQTTLPVQNNNQPSSPGTNANVQTNTRPGNINQNKIADTSTQVEIPFTSLSIINDSIVKTEIAQGNEIPLTLPKTMDTIPVKKTRGVTNISNDDYKIVPKNDSSRN